MSAYKGYDMLDTHWYPITTLLTGLTCLLLAVFVWNKGKSNKVNTLFSLFTLSIATWCFGAYVVNITSSSETALRWVRIFHIAAVFPPPLSIDFLYAVTGRDRHAIRWTYLPSVVFLLFVFTPQFITGVVPAPYIGFSYTTGVAYVPFIIFFFSATLFGLWVIYHGYRTSSGHKRIQLRYFLLAFSVIFVGSIIYFLLSIRSELSMPPVDNFFIALFVSIIAYAILRYRLMDITIVITRTVVFAGVYVLVLGLPLLGALAWQSQLETALGEKWWIGLWVVCSVLATAAHYANLYFQKRAEGKLLAEQRRYQETLRQAAQGMTLVKDMQRLLNLIVHILTRSVKVRHAEVWLLDKDSGRFVLKAMRGHNDTELNGTVEANQPLIVYLHKGRESLLQEELRLMMQGGAREELKPVVEEMARIGAAVIIPSFVDEKLLGFLVMSEKKSGKIYSTDDLRVFEVLASQAALAIENAQFYEDLKETQAELFQTAKLASLGQMAGGMSHQINNRFYVLTILAGTLKSALGEVKVGEPVTPELAALLARTRETMTKIEDNALRGGDIVKTLLRFSRPGKVEAKPITPQEIVAVARDVAQYKVDLTSIDFVQEWPASLPEVNGNLNQLADCFFNLITNAYDAIQARIEKFKPLDYRGRITISGHPAVDGRVSMDIVDNGIGMNKQEMDQLFVPFFTTKATAEKGTGLGLFVIKRILEHHGGNIAVQSSSGQGTTFTIFLPAVGGQGGQGGVVKIG
ncbi:MAG: GAF domain-containing protein [Candidatus Omnitrophica bacterium]|nr:GAF domain-containing protein [Candidatus Omnitrophota bacterium]